MRTTHVAGGAVLALLAMACGDVRPPGAASTALDVETRHTALRGGGDPFGVGPLTPVRKGRADRHGRVQWRDMARRAALWPPAQPQDRHFRRKRPPHHKHPQPESPPFTDSLIALIPDDAQAPPTGAFGPADGPDPGLDGPRPRSPAPSSSFLGLGDNNSSIPPDTHGAVGPNHLMVTLNTEVRIQDRAGGELSKVRLDDFWDEFGLDAFDPRIHYDPQEDRWIFVATADAGAATSAILIGATETDDPTGAWHLYSVDADADDVVWADYPTVGFNRHWVVVDINMFTNDGNNFSSGEVFVFDKADLYAGGEGAFTQLSIGSIGTASPAVVHDPDLDELHLLVTWNGNFNGHGFVRVYTVSGAVGSEQIDPGAFARTPNPWTFSPPDGDEIGPQLDSEQLLQTNDSRMQKVTYRNGSLWAAQTVHLPAGGAATHAAVQWWELDPHNVQSNLMAVNQFGRLGGVEGDVHFAFPSIAVNGAGDALLGYSRMAPDQYASANYSFRLAGDAASTMQADAVLKAGEASYHKTFGGETNRWGDYSATMVDPTDDTALWTLQMYASERVGDHDRWGTWWGSITPDNAPPEIDALADQQVSEGQLLEFTVSASDPDGQVLNWSSDSLPDGATLDAADGDFSWRPGYDQAGSYDVTFTVSDGTASANTTIAIDVADANAPPVLDPIGDLELGERDLFEVDITASDLEDDPITFSMDPTPQGATLGADSGRFSWTPTRAQIGEHVVTFSATSNGVSDSEQVTLTVIDDNRAPVLDPIGDRAVDEGAALVIAITGDDPDGDSLEFLADGLPTGASLGADSGRFTWTPGFDQSGRHDITFRVRDVSLEDSEQVTLTVNHVNVPPVLAPVGPRRGAEATPMRFTLDASDFDGDPLTFGVADLPTGASLDADSGQFDWTPSFDQSGQYFMTLSVSDGPSSDQERVELIIDNVNRGPLLASIDRQTIDEGERMELPLQWSDPDGDPVQIVLEQAPQGASIDVGARLLIWQPGFDQAGLHEFRILATDGDLERRRTFSVDVGNVNRPPTLEVDGPRIGEEALELVLTVTGGDPDGDPTFLAAPTLPVGAAFDSPSGRFAWTPTYDQAGEHEARFVVSDGALVVGVDVILNIANTNRPPQVAVVRPARLSEDELLELQLEAVDPDGDAFSWSLRNPPRGAAIDADTGALAWRPGFDQAGDYVLIALADDGSDAGERAIAVTVDNVNRPPAADVPPPQRVDENRPLALDLSAVDPDGEALTWSADNLPPGANFDGDGGRLRWTPTFDDSGEYVVTFRVSDGDLTDTVRVVITVVHVNRRPTIESPGFREGHEDQPFSLDLVAADPDDDRLVFTALGLPEGARLDGATGEIRWTPGFDQAGEYRVSVRAHDGLVFAQAETDWRILDVNRPPVLAPVDPVLGAEGQAIAVDLTAEDPDGDAIRYTSAGLPAGATLDRNTGALRWTPDFEQARIYDFVVVAGDGKGGEDRQSVRLEIADVDRPPVVAPMVDRRVAEGVLLEVTVVASDPDVEAVTLTAEALPQGAEFDAGARVLRWTPTFDQAGEHEARFVATARDLSGTGTLRIVVTDVNRPPVADVVEPPVVREGEALTTTVTALDPDGDPLMLTAVELPEGAEVHDGAKEVRWTPGFGDAGEHLFAVRLTDGDLGVVLRWVTTVLDVNRPPTLTGPDELVVVVGEELAFTLEGADPDNDTLAYSVTGLPQSAALESLSGRFFWKPSAGEAGAHEALFVVTDGEFEAELVRTIRVDDANRPPVIEPIADQEVTVGEELRVTLEATDPDGDLLSVKLADRPGGLLLDMAALIIAWTPGPPQVGEHALKVVVSDGQLEASEEFLVKVKPAPEPQPGDPGFEDGLDTEDRLAPPPAGGGDKCLGTIAGPAADTPAGPPSALWLLPLALAYRRRKRR